MQAWMTGEGPVEPDVDNTEARRWGPAVSSRGQRGRDGEETPKEWLCPRYRFALLVLRN